jgi:hypothetical protein
MKTLRTKLLAALTEQFGHEASNAVTRLKDSVTPYTRFIIAERERIEKSETSLAAMRQKLSELKARSQTSL